MKQINILFVCMGNICRSPTAEGYFKHIIERDIDISPLRGRKVESEDFDAFDYIIAMDHSNYSDLEGIAGRHKNKLFMFLEFSKKFTEDEVPDPYYGGDDGFEHVLNLIEDASNGLLTHIRKEYSL